MLPPTGKIMPRAKLKAIFTIRLTVVSIFILASLLTALIAIALQYHFNRSIALQSAVQLYDYAAKNTSEYIDQKDEQIVRNTQLLANFNDLLSDRALHTDSLQLFADIMHNNPLYNSIYIAFSNGDLQQLINISARHKNREQLQATASDRWVFSTISGKGQQRRRQYFYYDKNFNLRATREEKSNYNATQRIWYKNAQKDKVTESPAYRFAHSNILGQTYSAHVENSDIVIAIDVTLNSLSEVLTTYSDTHSSTLSEIYIYKKSGKLLASNVHDASNKSNIVHTIPHAMIATLTQDKRHFNQLLERQINGTSYYIYIAPVGKKHGNINYIAILSPEETLLANSMSKVTISALITALCLLLLLPLSWLFSYPIINPIKALAEEAEKVKLRRYKDLKPIHSSIIEIQELNNSMMDMSHSIEVYQAEQKELMESIIKLIAQAIDEKSPYTAGHCNRVPELGLMLITAVQESELPAFKEFKFKDEDEHREFRIAAWLHDCGKITTPEYIVDKGTKLEAVHNRIHEIRMRFEVLWRDAEIRYYQQCQANPQQRETLKAALTSQHLTLKKDFSFIAECNIGGETMAPENITRLQQIGDQTWVRNFDDRQGLSPIEELNLTAEAMPLPATEKLLCDKQEHIIKRIHPIHFDPAFGIHMDIPDNLYNRGELYNLSIERGTLTPEDRFKINQHITSTIAMLENLPFPPELAKVPRYASTHHETLNGTGYPRKLHADDLSIPERVLVIADIFEALTAADRPYKKAKPISVAINILYHMAIDQHIDMDLFKLFLTSGTYLAYATQFLDTKQIDDVDISQYLQ